MVQALAVMSSAEIQHKTSQPSQDNGGKGARLTLVIAFPAQRISDVSQPVFNRVSQEDFVESGLPQRHSISLKVESKEWFGIRRAHPSPNCFACLRKAGSLYLAVSDALLLSDLRQNLDHHLLF